MYVQQYFPQPTSDSRQKQQEADQDSFIIMGQNACKHFLGKCFLAVRLL